MLTETDDPAGLCAGCTSVQWWQLPGQAWHCRACEPDIPSTATTLTLPCHKVELRPVAARAELRTVFENACQGLSITPEQLRQELEAAADIPDVVSGTLTPKALKVTAKTLALMRYPYPPEPRVSDTTARGRMVSESKREC